MYIREQLMKARHDERLRVAARGRLAIQTRRAHAERTGDAVAAPGRRPASMRLRLRQLFS
jgi:hypothetical protein